MSKRRLIILGSLVIILAVIFGTYILLTKQPGNGEQEPTGTTTSETSGDHDEDIFDFPSTDVMKIVIDRKGEPRMVFERLTGTKTEDDGTETEYEYFGMTEPSGYDADPSSINTYVSNITWLYEMRYIGEVDDFSEYGLEDPVLKVSVALKNGEEHSIDVGDLTLSNDGYYVNVGGGNDVRVLHKYRGDSLFTDIKKILNKTIFTMTADDVAEYRIKRAGEEETAVRLKTDEEMEDIRFSFEKYKMIEPFEFNANSSNILTNITAFLECEVKEYIELEAEDMSVYGLKDPAYRLSFTGKDGTSSSIEIGKSNDEGNARYARFEGMDAVFTLSNDCLTLIDMPLKEMVSSFVFIANITDITGIRVKTPEHELECVIEHTEDEEGTKSEVFFVNGKDANAIDENKKSYFRTFYQSLLGVLVSSFDFQASPRLDPEVSFIFEFDGSDDVRVDYVKKDDYNYYAFIDGNYTGILVRNTSFTDKDKIYVTIPRLLESLN